MQRTAPDNYCWASRLLPCPGYYKQCCDEHWGTRVSFPSGFLSVYAQQWDCWIIRQHNSFYFRIVCCNLSFFISNFVDLIHLLFSLDGSAKVLSILFIFSKNQLLVLLIFTIISFISFSFISAQIFMIFFLLLILFFVLFCFSFSSCFRCKVRLSIRCFPCFLR